MMNLDLLGSLLKKVTLDTPHENVEEEHFDQIVTFIEQDKIPEAVVLIEKIFSKGIPDIRLIVYYFYAYLFNNGIKSFIDIFPGIISVVDEHWDKLRPLNRKEKHIQNSLNWFFSHVLIKLKYSEKLYKSGKTDAALNKFIIEVSQEEINNLITRANEFKNFFMEKWPKSATKERVLHLVKRIEELKPLIIQETKPSEEEISTTDESNENIKIEKQNEISIESDISPEEQELQEVQQQIEEVASNIIDEFIAPNVDKESLIPLSNAIEEKEKSALLEELDKFSHKLKVFELFISKNDYLKAAVVAKDIDHLLENFDPLNYFPKLFAKYFSLFAKHVAALSEQYENKDTLQVKYLEKLYKTDLDMFIDW